jgi:type II secretory pathway component PulF
MNDSLREPSGVIEKLRQERDSALEDAAKWRRRYETEAQQRQAEAETADRTIRNLRAEILQLCQLGPAARSAAPAPRPMLPVQDAQKNTLERLTHELALLTQSRDELAAALTQEQRQHAKTRENLISALGEALQRPKSP